jgi:hypothetical protein
VDVTFELLWRRDGVDDVTLATWNHHFDPKGGGDFTATAYEEDVDGTAIDFVDGDQLVFRYTGDDASPGSSYVPNGEGESNGGRHPYFDVPR